MSGGGKRCGGGRTASRAKNRTRSCSQCAPFTSTWPPWALQEPAKWAVWVAPCPVPQRELRGIARRRRQVSEEIAGRTRQRQPLLPRLVEQAEQDHALYSDLLAAGQAAAPGQAFTAGGRTWIRVFSKADARREREHGRANVRLRDAGTGQVVHIDRQEERAFWEWAIVETLRHSGIRIEELLRSE